MSRNPAILDSQPKTSRNHDQLASTVNKVGSSTYTNFINDKSIHECP